MKLVGVLLLLCFSACVRAECQKSCKVCNEDNYCEECFDGHFLVPRVPGAYEGLCFECSVGCSKCFDGSLCYQCKTGFVQGSDDCPQCSRGCDECQNSSTNCTVCSSNYISDGRGFCFYKYSLVIIVCLVVAFLVTIVAVRCCYVAIQKRKLKRPSFYPETVLDNDSRKNTYFINDVRKIGQTDDDQEVSNVANTDETQEKFIMEKTVAKVLGEHLKEH